MNSHSPSTHLNTADCWTLLEAQRVGRLALTDERGAPDIFPVNFAAYQGAIYIRTAPDIKDVYLTARPEAAFEVDGHDDSGWWSVVVRGTTSQVPDPVEVERSGIARIPSASTRHKTHVIKITSSVVTGRRFPDRAPALSASGDGNSAVTGSLAVPLAENNAGRRTRPVTIPSHPPLNDGT